MKYCEDLAQKSSLLENELHVWSISLIQPEKILQKLAGLLDENERTKADKFKFEIDRQNYIVAHGAMRQILAKYLECKPENIIFNFNDYGKPFLPENKYQIEFNLSHSKSRALVAVAKNKRVGIDIEFIRAEIVESNIAGAIFFSQRKRGFTKSGCKSATEGIFRLLDTQRIFYQSYRKRSVISIKIIRCFSQTR